MKRILLFLLVATFFGACSKVMITGRKQFLLVSDAEVLSMSAVAYKQFIDSVPVVKGTPHADMVQRVGENISKAVIQYMKTHNYASDTANYAWEYSLVKDSTVNAFCMPGGKVVFYEGILPVTQSEAGLAVVMGHEIAHAVAKHSNERLSQQMVASFGAGLADFLVSNRSVATRQTINILYGLGAQYGVILPYSRKHEYEADRLGVIFMAMAGYDPNESVTFWERMASQGSGSALDFMSTHPSDEKRIAKMKEVISEAMTYLPKE